MTCMVSEERISKFGKQFSVGSNHQCRVVQFNYMDNAVVVSLQKYMYVCVCVCVCVCTHPCVCTVVYACVCACMCVCVDVRMCVHVGITLCMKLFSYVFVHLIKGSCWRSHL